MLRRGGGRGDRQDDDDEKRGPLGGGKEEDRGPDRYKMREKVFDIGDDYWIETQRGRRAYKVDGKALHLRKTLILEDARGVPQYEVQAKVISVKDAMTVEKGRGRAVATVKKALISPLRDRLTANMAGGPDIDIKGNLLNHEYQMERRGKRICEVSKKWIALRDTYTVEIEAGEDDALILALTVVVEQMCMD